MAAIAAAAQGETKAHHPTALNLTADLTRRAGTVASHAGEEAAVLDKFYITTAINYTNGNPHVGHAYEAITTDVVARYHRVFGRDVFFLTGTDEHGQKIAARAAAEGCQPIDICNRYAGQFQALNERLHISNDFYVRTTQEDHKRTAQTLWRKCAAKGDIWLGAYEGWYDVCEEAYVTEADAEKALYKDKKGNPLTKMSEPSYLFNMEKYRAPLVAHIEANEDFIRPASRRNEILRRLRDEPLRDLSVSRTNFDWGIPVPDDDEHVMYVWFDALSNYISGVRGLEPDAPHAGFWPADVHVIGKDIIWFHCVIWPCMLLSAEVPLPGGVFAHGFVNDATGKKMSKSLGNVVDPNEQLDKYGADTLRFYIVRETHYGDDMPFDEQHLVDLHNANLADGLGNLLRRGLGFCAKYSDGTIPAEEAEVPFDVGALAAAMDRAARAMRLKELVVLFVDAVGVVNKYITSRQPWKLKADPVAQRAVTRAVLESCYYFAHLLQPVCPTASAEMFRQLGAEARTLGTLSAGFDNLTAGAPIIDLKTAPILFQKIQTAAEERAAKMEEAKRAKQKKKKKKSGGGGGGGTPADPNQDPFTRVDIRVGQILEVWNHPAADTLYCEKIDVGEEEPRQIASGLREHYTPEQMVGRKVLVVCNLKVSKMRGFPSNGMVLCAKDAEGRTEFIDPPSESKCGERVAVEGFTGQPLSVNQAKKAKAWKKLQPQLRTDEQRQATWEGRPMLTSAGPCTVSSLVGATIK